MYRTQQFFIYHHNRLLVPWNIPPIALPMPTADDENLYWKAVADANDCEWFFPQQQQVRIVYDAIGNATGFFLHLDAGGYKQLLASTIEIPSLAEYLEGRPGGV